MARKGIDYPDSWVSALGCGVRCSINKLYTMLRGRIAKINSVTPDGNSQINIVSDSSQLTVTDDPDNYAVRLKVDLDGTDGLVTTDTAQTVTGAKTFTSPITASGGVTGNLTGNADTATTANSATYWPNPSFNAGSDTRPIRIVGGYPVNVDYDLVRQDAPVITGTIEESRSAALATDGSYTSDRLKDDGETIEEKSLYKFSDGYGVWNYLYPIKGNTNTAARLVYRMTTSGTVTLYIEKWVAGVYSYQYVMSF